MYKDTVLNVAHVRRTTAQKKWANPAIAAGMLSIAAGLGLFAFEVSQDWDTYQQSTVDHATAGKAAPVEPGMHTGALGFALALFGLVPVVAGASALRGRERTSYTIGEAPSTDIQTSGFSRQHPHSFNLVGKHESSGALSLNFTRDMAGEIDSLNATASLSELIDHGQAVQDDDKFCVSLDTVRRARIVHGDLAFYIRPVAASQLKLAASPVDRAFWSATVGTGAAAGLLLFLNSMIPDDLSAFALDENLDDNRFIGYLNTPDENKEEPPRDNEPSKIQEEAGGHGTRHVGSEGKMGDQKAKSPKGLYSMKGPKDAIPQLARNLDLDQNIRDNSILGLLASSSGGILATPFGEAFQVGNQDEDVWGGLDGSEVASAFGVGGLGVNGTGRGGGGTGEGTIGLGNTGLIGMGAGGGDGSGYGRGNGHGGTGSVSKFKQRRPDTPRVKPGAGIVTGAIDKGVIRRIVRAHINEVSACYNRGLSKNPNLRGRVAVQFLITGTGKGKVSKSVVQETSLKDRSVSNCIAKAVKRWKFPRTSNGGNAMVTYPFQLTS